MACPWAAKLLGDLRNHSGSAGRVQPFLAAAAPKLFQSASILVGWHGGSQSTCASGRRRPVSV